MARENLESRIGLSTDRFVNAVVGMSPEQWAYRSPKGGWNASEITEHVAIANRNVLRQLGSGLQSLSNEQLGVTDDEIPFLFYRGDEPPNVAAPTGTWTDLRVAADALVSTSDALVSWLAATDLDLRAHGAAHPAFGTLDAYQWLLFASAHTERHRAQIIGLKRHADFPSATR